VKIERFLITAIGLLGACAHYPEEVLVPPDARLAKAEALIDAFYSFEPGRLRDALSAAPASAPKIIYYQGWAEGGNYRVLQRRPCFSENTTEIRCDITVKDDLITALGTGFDVTDSFHITFKAGENVAVRTSSNDPPDMDQAFKWLRAKNPAIWDGPCQGFYAGGITPQDCVRAIVKGFIAYRAQHPLR